MSVRYIDLAISHHGTDKSRRNPFSLTHWPRHTLVQNDHIHPARGTFQIFLERVEDPAFFPPLCVFSHPHLKRFVPPTAPFCPLSLAPCTCSLLPHTLLSEHDALFIIISMLFSLPGIQATTSYTTPPLPAPARPLRTRPLRIRAVASALLLPPGSATARSSRHSSRDSFAFSPAFSDRTAAFRSRSDTCVRTKDGSASKCPSVNSDMGPRFRRCELPCVRGVLLLLAVVGRAIVPQGDLVVPGTWWWLELELEL